MFVCFAFVTRCFVGFRYVGVFDFVDCVSAVMAWYYESLGLCVCVDLDVLG